MLKKIIRKIKIKKNINNEINEILLLRKKAINNLIEINKNI